MKQRAVMAIATCARAQGHRRRRADERARRGRAAPGHADARPAAGRARRRGRADRPRHGADRAVRRYGRRHVRGQARRDRPGPADHRSAAAPLHPAADRQPARHREEAGAARHPRPAAARSSTCRRGVQLQPALPVRVRALPARDAASARGRAGARTRPATSIRSTIACRRSTAGRRRRHERAHRAQTRAPSSYGAFTALDDVSLSLREDAASMTAIAGESGSGKTTLARMLLGLHPAERRRGDLPGQGPRHACRAPSSASSAARSSRSSRIRSTSSTRSTGSTTCCTRRSAATSWRARRPRSAAMIEDALEPRRAAAGRHARALSARAERRPAPAHHGGARGAAAPADHRRRRAGLDGRRLAPRDDPRRAAHAEPGPRDLDRLHHPRPDHRLPDLRQHRDPLPGRRSPRPARSSG